MIQQEDTIDFLYASISPGRVIPAGEAVEMIGTTFSHKDANLLLKWFGGGGKVKVRIRYSSVYEDQWVTETGGSPQTVESKE